MIAIGYRTRISPRDGLLACLIGLIVFHVLPLYADELQSAFENPPAEAAPWTFWYWNKGAISSEGITADLEAMHNAGIGGAYLMTIKGGDSKLWDPPVEQLSPTWWERIRHAFQEAQRLNLKFAMHVCDGFATAGGPWITPAQSMQKVVWSETYVSGDKPFQGKLPQPETNEDYYRDLVVFAIPVSSTPSSETPRVTTSVPDLKAQFLTSFDSNERVRLDEPGWIQYEYNEPFTCRTITVTPDGNSFQANRLLVSVSDDGKEFREVARLKPPRHGWQNGSGTVTHSIPPTTGRFFRFSYDPAGTEPGGEDLDSAKWKPTLKVRSIVLENQPRLHQVEGKNGSVWRVSQRANDDQIANTDCVPLDKIKNITSHLQQDGTLDWNVPSGEWLILRMGHTSTGTHNETGGAARGLECDKFNPAVVKLQFDKWFGEVIRQIGPELTENVLTGFHVDSWECGSQNWSPVFAAEFERRRGYDLMPYLPVLAGIPITSADVSERVLYDVRQTITDLIVDNFFGTLRELAHEHDCQFSAESVAPTMVSDGMRHFGAVDLSMGEFWLRSPTHDKPNDMRDAISAAHVYGKPIVQAEAFTELRMAWDEHPGLIKALGDRQLALGANRFVYHVFNHNPWMDRKPGMSLDQIGLFFQRDQTWWPAVNAFIDYHKRCQAMLQAGKPVVDIAVFTGEEIPSRALLPETLVTTLPGIVGEVAVARESERLANVGTPQRELPAGVNHSANMTDPADWVDPLRGYSYDSVNPDALLRLAKVEDGRLKFAGGLGYQLLIMPMPRPLSPHPELITYELAEKLGSLVQAGAKIAACVHGRQSPSLENYPAADEKLLALLGEPPADGTLTTELPGTVRQIGQGELIYGPITADSFSNYGIDPDFIAYTTTGKPLHNLAWNHRRSDTADWYFVSNQSDSAQEVVLSLREQGKQPEIWDPVTGEIHHAKKWTIVKGRTVLPVRLEPNGSLFVVFREVTDITGQANGINWSQFQEQQALTTPWQVSFDESLGGPNETIEFAELVDWSHHSDTRIRHYSGTGTYTNKFQWDKSTGKVWLDLGQVANIAEVRVNGIACGTAWTPPYRIDVTQALREGDNELSIAVTNTWANRLIGDARLPVAERFTWTTAPPLPSSAKLLPGGLLGPVTLLTEVQSDATAVSPEDMQAVFDEVNTPFKFGVLLEPEQGQFLDCPNVFRHDDAWYMVYVAITDKVGYETCLARSEDLLKWEPLGKILPFAKEGWDKWQADGSIALVDPEWGGTSELQSFNGKYWMSYFGGAKQGYETDPLSIGMAWTTEPQLAKPWHRLAENPVLTPDHPGARDFEKATLYKSHILWDKTKSLGAPFVMFYNAKQKGPWIERIGMATSDDMVHWQHYGKQPVIDNFKGISGDPQIVRMGDMWVMFYFGAGWKKGAFDTFACSRDLVNWTKWTGEDLINPSEPWDKTFAHKPWLLKHDGVVYHFYCAVAGDNRTIALATSRDLRPTTEQP